MTDEKTPAPERIYVGQWDDGQMHYQWTPDRSELSEWEHGMPDAPEIDEGPRGTVVEYVRADLFEKLVERVKELEAKAGTDG